MGFFFTSTILTNNTHVHGFIWIAQRSFRYTRCIVRNTIGAVRRLLASSCLLLIDWPQYETSMPHIKSLCIDTPLWITRTHLAKEEQVITEPSIRAICTYTKTASGGSQFDRLGGHCELYPTRAFLPVTHWIHNWRPDCYMNAWHKSFRVVAVLVLRKTSYDNRCNGEWVPCGCRRVQKTSHAVSDLVRHVHKWGMLWYACRRHFGYPFAPPPNRA